MQPLMCEDLYEYHWHHDVLPSPANPEIYRLKQIGIDLCLPSPKGFAPLVTTPKSLPTTYDAPTRLMHRDQPHNDWVAPSENLYAPLVVTRYRQHHCRYNRLTQIGRQYDPKTASNTVVH